MGITRHIWNYMLTILSIKLLILRPYFYALIVFEFHAKHDSFSDFVYMHSGITAFILCMNTENEDMSSIFQRWNARILLITL